MQRWCQHDRRVTNAPIASAATVASRGTSHQVGKAACWSLVTIVAALLGAYLVLTGTDGLGNSSGSSNEAELVNKTVWMTAFGLVVPVYLAARASPYVAPAVVLAAAWPQFYVAKVVVERYQASGWGEGMESLNEVQAGFMAAAYVVAALLGAGTRAGRPARP